MELRRITSHVYSTDKYLERPTTEEKYEPRKSDEVQGTEIDIQRRTRLKQNVDWDGVEQWVFTQAWSLKLHRYQNFKGLKLWSRTTTSNHD